MKNSIAQCKKLIAESERDNFKPTISHYRDNENGMREHEKQQQKRRNKELFDNYIIKMAEGKGTEFATPSKLQKVFRAGKLAGLTESQIQARIETAQKRMIERAKKMFPANFKNPTTRKTVNPQSSDIIENYLKSGGGGLLRVEAWENNTVYGTFRYNPNNRTFTNIDKNQSFTASEFKKKYGGAKYYITGLTNNPSSATRSAVAGVRTIQRKLTDARRPIALESFTHDQQKVIRAYPNYFEVSDGYVYKVRSGRKNPTTKTATKNGTYDAFFKRFETGETFKENDIINIHRAGKPLKVYYRIGGKWINVDDNKPLTTKQLQAKYPTSRLSYERFKNPAPVKRANFTNGDFKNYQKIQIEKLAEMFQGVANGQSLRVLESDLAPPNKFRLGWLVLAKVRRNGQTIPIEFDGQSLLSADGRRNLWIVGKDSRLDGASLKALGVKPPTGNGLEYIGDLFQIDYVTAKKHIENGETVHFFHKLGEADKIRPRLYIDKDGFPIIHGGNYDIWDVGIVN
jgi:hypothetical protein